MSLPLLDLFKKISKITKPGATYKQLTNNLDKFPIHSKAVRCNSKLRRLIRDARSVEQSNSVSTSMLKQNQSVFLMRMNLQDIYQERELVLAVIKVGLILIS